MLALLNQLLDMEIFGLHRGCKDSLFSRPLTSIILIRCKNDHYNLVAKMNESCRVGEWDERGKRAFSGVLSAFRFEMKERSDRGSKTPNSECFRVVVFLRKSNLQMYRIFVSTYCKTIIYIYVNTNIIHLYIVN